MPYLYEFSISMQLSGSLILLIWCFAKISTNVLDMCFPGVIFAKRKENGDLYIDKELIRQKIKNIFLNIFAFFISSLVMQRPFFLRIIWKNYAANLL